MMNYNELSYARVKKKNGGEIRNVDSVLYDLSDDRKASCVRKVGMTNIIHTISSG